MTRVTVEGRVIVGRRLELRQAASRTIDYDASFDDFGFEDDSPYHSDRSFLMNASSVRRRRLSYELIELDETLAIENDGLLVSYGLFGGPGSGKTNLLKALLKGIV